MVRVVGWADGTPRVPSTPQKKKELRLFLFSCPLLATLSLAAPLSCFLLANYLLFSLFNSKFYAKSWLVLPEAMQPMRPPYSSTGHRLSLLCKRKYGGWVTQILGGFYKLLSIDFVRFFTTDVFSPRHSANTSWFALCSRLIENVLISSRFPCGRREQRFAKRAQKMLVSFAEPKKRQRS